jgi:2,3-bisphosphoglycerate-independent phosphoglycerate mutase
VVHAFTDGRDAPTQSAKTFFDFLDEYMKKNKIGRLATIIGRYYSMDRDNRWDRTKLAYNLISKAEGTKAGSWAEALDLSYKDNITDEFIKPFVIAGPEQSEDNNLIVQANDSLVFFNYRADRAYQLARAFADDQFNDFPRERIQNLYFAGFTNYEKSMPMNRAIEDTLGVAGESKFVKEYFEAEMKRSDEGFPENQVFPLETVENNLGSMIAKAGKSQLRITESEKFPHVTYFFNCRMKGSFDREDRIEIPSPKDVATYDQKPEMSAPKVTERLIKETESQKYDFILVNYALTDMVAHTGNIKASVRAVETADVCLGQLVSAAQLQNYDLIVTADHGNIEELINLRTKQIDTQHSTNPVPFVYVPAQAQSTAKPAAGLDLSNGMLVDIAPTVLNLLQIDTPEEMTGRNLL